MICDEARSLVSARLDRELGGDSAAALELHLGSCPACRAAASQAERLDAGLRRAFADRRRNAARVADRVARRFSPPRRSRRVLATIGMMALSAAAGYAIALLWNTPLSSIPVNRAPTAVATLSVATGPIEVLRAGATAWQLLATGEPIEAGARLRSGPESRCEIRTNDGSEVRINYDSELKVTDTRQFDLARGQAWSTVAHAAAPFSVRVADAVITALGTRFDVQRTDAGTQLTVIDGATRIAAGNQEATVRAGEAVTLTGGRLGEVHRVDDLVVATRWIHDILVLKGRDNPELGRRIDELLAQIGETKVDFMYEQEVKALGDHCALPLTRFIQSDRSRGDENKRVRAAQILSDMAQPWCIPELIGLLNDADGRVRELAARSLRRLTGQTHGRTPESWREQPLAGCEDTLERWRRWWEENKHRYPGAQDAEKKPKGEAPPGPRP